MRRALVVGIDEYDNISRLYGCVNDAHSVKAMLERHSDGSVNFDVKLLVTSDEPVYRKQLRGAVESLFKDDCDVALLYFAGHGHLDAAGGYLCAGDTELGDDGLALSEILAFANRSKARNKVIILDSCHSGVAGSRPTQGDTSEISDGMTILTASTAEQYADEENGSGVFTHLFVDALGGAAANLVGEVTPGGVYAHIDQSLGAWTQRPVFKTNVKTFISLRTVSPAIELSDLRKIVQFFPDPSSEFKLDPQFEPEGPDPKPEKCAQFAILQKYNRVNLLVPVGAPHMYHAAMEGRSVKLTALGEHYRRLVQRGLI